MTFVKRISDEERFMAKVIPEPNSGCWLWTASVNEDGYAQFGLNKRSVRAHRWAYEHFIGSVPTGLMLDHRCRVRCCVNPAHLQPVSNRENALRGAEVGNFGKGNRNKTHCSKGHPFDSQNTMWKANRTRRVCRTCARDRWARENAQRAARTKALRARQSQEAR